MAELACFFPPGIQYDVPYDTAPFVEVSIEKVLHTLLEAIGLVFVVMLLFLQSFRYTIIPTLVVPVALLGTCAVRSEEHTSELQSLMRISYAVFCLTKKTKRSTTPHIIAQK